MVSYAYDRKFRKLSRKVQYLYTKELDLINFIKRYRMSAIATLSLLNRRQRQFA